MRAYTHTHIHIHRLMKTRASTHAPGWARTQICNIYLFFTTTMVLWARLNVTLYVDCSCCWIMHAHSELSSPKHNVYSHDYLVRCLCSCASCFENWQWLHSCFYIKSNKSMFMYITGSKTTLEVLLMTSVECNGRDFDTSKTLAGRGMNCRNSRPY